MALQRTSEGKSGSRAYSREAALSISIRQRRAEFESMPPRVQAETLERVIALLKHEARRPEFRAHPSELKRTALQVYGIRIQDL